MLASRHVKLNHIFPYRITHYLFNHFTTQNHYTHPPILLVLPLCTCSQAIRNMRIRRNPINRRREYRGSVGRPLRSALGDVHIWQPIISHVRLGGRASACRGGRGTRDYVAASYAATSPHMLMNWQSFYFKKKFFCTFRGESTFTGTRKSAFRALLLVFRSSFFQKCIWLFALLKFEMNFCKF